MNIAIVADPYVSVPPKKYGGTEQVIFNEIIGLRELGHEPILLAAGDSVVPCELIPTTPKAIGFPAKLTETNKFRRLQGRIAISTQALLEELMDSRRIDIIHSHASIASSLDLNRITTVPSVTTLHSPIQLSDIPYFELQKQARYITISHNQQAALPSLSYAGVAYNGQDVRAFPIVEEPDDYLCFIGRFDRDKNPHLAIMLAISLGMQIKIAGKRDYMGDGYFEEEIEPYLAHPLVEYLGEIDFEAKVNLVSRARCNIHPTGFREPFGLTVVEAAYCGTPTIAIKRGALPELIEEGRTGLLVEDMIEGYTRINECFEMDRQYIATRARSLFNHTEMAKTYVRIFEKILEETDLTTNTLANNPPLSHNKM